MCHVCDKLCSSAKELSCHLAGKHHVKQPLRLKIDSFDCLSCGKHFHTRYRIVSHIAYNSPSCKNYYIKKVPNIDEARYVELEQEESLLSSYLRKNGKRPGYHHIPPVQALFVRPFNPGIDIVPNA